jgi:hypothetical protein
MRARARVPGRDVFNQLPRQLRALDRRDPDKSSPPVVVGEASSSRSQVERGGKALPGGELLRISVALLRRYEGREAYVAMKMTWNPAGAM